MMMQKNNPTESIKNIKLFYLFSFLDGFWPCSPFFIIYFSEITGSFTLAMSLSAIHNLTTTFLEVPTGILSDKLKRKNVTFIGAAAVFIAACFYVTADNYISLVLASLFYGLYTALMSGNNEALIYDSLKENGKEKEFHKVLGKKEGFYKLSFGISALTGAGIVWMFGIRETFYAIVVTSLLMMVISQKMIEPETHTDEISDNPFIHFGKSMKNVWKNKRLRYLTLASSLDYGIGMAAYDFINVFFNRFIPTWLIGVLRTAAYSLGSVGSFLSHKISVSFGYTRTIITFIGLNYVINIVSVLTNSIVSPFIKVFDNLTYSVAEPAQNTLMQNDFTDKQRATMGSVVSLFRSLFYGIFSLLVGMMADVFSVYTSLLVMYIAFFFLLPLYYKGLKSG